MIKNMLNADFDQLGNVLTPLSILVAEDSRTLAQLLVSYLEQKGHRVTLVGNGRLAVEKFIETPPDLVLMDAMMPEMDGFEATRHIKAMQLERWIPVLMLTALDDHSHMVHGLHAGADGYLTKPFKKEVLDAHIRSMQRIAQMQNRLTDTIGHLNSFFDNTLDGIVIIDGFGIIHAFNRSAEKMFGYLEADVVGKNINCLMPSSYAEHHDNYLLRYRDGQGGKMIGARTELVAKRADNSTFPVSIGLSELVMATGETRIIGLLTDITEREEARKRIEFLALHDKLTGLPNRELLNEEIKHSLAQAKRNDEKVGLLFIDLDGFKPINDTYGHAAGDIVLQEVAKRIKSCLRGADVPARVGGDEFVILLPNMLGAEGAKIVAGKILHAFNQAIKLEHDVTCRVGASIGIALYPDHAHDMDSLLRAADDAMYVAKRSGKNAYHLATTVGSAI